LQTIEPLSPKIDETLFNYIAKTLTMQALLFAQRIKMGKGLPIGLIRLFKTKRR
jgi:hypothetical protein